MEECVAGSPRAASRYCRAGRHIGEFPPQHTIYSFLVCFTLFLCSWRLWSLAVRRCRHSRWLQAAVSSSIIFVWSNLYAKLHPPDPYWTNELCVMCIVVSALKMLDHLVWQDGNPEDLPFSALILDYALVLRSDTLKRKPGQRKPTGRSLLERARDAVPPLAWMFFQMCFCEAMNGWLMSYSRDDVFRSPYLFQCVFAYTLASALYLHLSYFFHSMVAVGILVFDHDASLEWPPLYNSPWLSGSPSEFWNVRWHQMFRDSFVRLAFNPTKLALLKLFESQQTEGSSQRSAFDRALKPELTESKTAAGDRLANGKDERFGEDQQNERHATPSRYSLRARREAPPASAPSKSPGRAGRPPTSDASATATVTGVRDSRSKTPQRQRRKSGAATQEQQQQGVQAKPGEGAAPDANTQHAAAAARARSGVSRSPVASAVLKFLPPLAVYVFSGVLHEVLLLISFGTPTGHQFCYFMVHFVGLMAQRLFRQYFPRQQVKHTTPGAKAKATVVQALKILAWNTFLLLTTPLFMKPWILNNYHRELRVLVPGPIHHFMMRLTYRE